MNVEREHSTYANTKRVSSVRIDGHKVISDHGDVVIVDCEDEDTLGRGINQS
jgi:hypothetical protein